MRALSYFVIASVTWAIRIENVEQLQEAVGGGLGGSIRALSSVAKAALTQKLKSIHIDSRDVTRIGVDKTGNVYFVDLFGIDNPQPSRPADVPRRRRRRYISNQAPFRIESNGSSLLAKL